MVAGNWWIVAVAILLVTVIHFVIQSQRTRRWQRAPGIPPGSMGLPLLGESLQFLLRPQQFVEKRLKLHGKMFSTFILGYPTVFSSDPRINKFVLHNEGRLFTPRYPASLNELMGKWNMSLSRGELHKKMRGAAMSFLSTTVIKNRLVGEIERLIVSNLQSWEGRIVDVLHETRQMTFSFMAHQLMGLSPGEELQTMKSDFDILRKGLLTLPIKAPGSTYSKSLQKRQKLLNQIKTMLQERRKLSSDPNYEDLISTLQKDNKFQLTTDQIMDLILGLLFGGYDTTSRTMALVVKRLCENPQAVRDLRTEHEAIRRNKEENEMLSWTDYKSMTFTKDVINETLRLRSVLDTVLFRQCLETVQLGGYEVPKGWTVIVLGRPSNLDSSYYKDPLSFNPWRWQEDDVNQAPFAPFGGGIRLCPGNELALLEVSFFVHHLVTKLKWELTTPNTKGRWFEYFTFNLVKNIKIRAENL